MKYIRRLSKFIVAFAPLVAISLIVFEVMITNRLAILGDKLTHVDREILSIEEQNVLLSEKIASASSLSTIMTKAHELGFAPVQHHVTFSPDQFSVALEKSH